MTAPTKYSLQMEMAAAHRVADALVAAGVTPEDPDYGELMRAETEIEKHLARLLRVARREEAEATGIATVEDDLVERRRRKQAKAEKLRAIVLEAMSDLGLQRLDAADMTVTRRAGKPAVVVTDEAALPEQYLVTKRTPDKRAIAAALAAGPVPGASLSNAADAITIRSR